VSEANAGLFGAGFCREWLPSATRAGKRCTRQVVERTPLA
jgi:hypothetical protein